MDFRDDIKEQTLKLLERIDIEQCDQQLSVEERHKLRGDMSRASALLS